MLASRPWLLWAVPFGLTAALAPILALVPFEATLRLLCTAVALAGLMVVLDGPPKAEKGWYIAARWGASFVIGALLSGAFALLFLITFYPRPGVGNLLWMLGIPILVALGQTRRELAMMVPIVVFGWIGFVVLAWALQIPVD